MSESPFSRFWNLVKPPPPVNRTVVPPQVLALRRRRRRLVMITLGVVLAMVAAVGVFAYIESAPQRADKEFQEGMKLMRPGKYPDAIVRFTRVLNISPQRADAYLERGNAHRSLSDLAQMIECDDRQQLSRMHRRRTKEIIQLPDALRQFLFRQNPAATQAA